MKKALIHPTTAVPDIEKWKINMNFRAISFMNVERCQNEPTIWTENEVRKVWLPSSADYSKTFEKNDKLIRNEKKKLKQNIF